MNQEAEDVMKQAEALGADPGHTVVDKFDNVWEEMPDGSWRYLGFVQGTALVSPARTRAGRNGLLPLSQAADPEENVPAGAVPMVDANKEVWDLADPTHARHLGRIGRFGYFIPDRLPRR